jgi:hypothetical protein
MVQGSFLAPWMRVLPPILCALALVAALLLPPPAVAQNTPLERFIESRADIPALDLVLLGRVSGGGVLTRTMSGDWTLKEPSLCVDLTAVTRYESRDIPLRVLGDPPPGVPATLRLRTIYAMLRFEPARNPGELIAGSGLLTQAGREYRDDLVAALAIELTDMFGADVAVKPHLDLTSDRCRPDAFLVPRILLDPAFETRPVQGSFKWRVDAGELGHVTEVTGPDLRVARVARLEELEDGKRAWREFLDRLAASPPRGAQALYGALSTSSGRVRPCLVNPTPEDEPRGGLDLRALMTSEEFRRFMTGRPEAARGFATADELFVDLKNPNGWCSVVLGNGPLLASLHRALERDRVSSTFLPRAFSEDALAILHAESLGFRGADGRAAVQAWLFSRAIGGATPDEVEALRALGVATREAHGEAKARFQRSGLGGEADTATLIAFLRDEREAAQRGIAVPRLRAEREVAARKAAAEAEAAAREAERRRAAEFPFVARITCTVGQTGAPIQACMSDDGLTTELELRNGGDYRMYKIHDVAQAGRQGSGTFEIDLRRSFELKVQNASDTLLLTLVVVGRTDGREIYRRSVARFGVLAVRN